MRLFNKQHADLTEKKKVAEAKPPDTTCLWHQFFGFPNVWGISKSPEVSIAKWLWINTYENTIFSGMNIHFNPAMTWCEQKRGTIGFDTLPKWTHVGWFGCPQIVHLQTCTFFFSGIGGVWRGRCWIWKSPCSVRGMSIQTARNCIQTQTSGW